MESIRLHHKHQQKIDMYAHPCTPTDRFVSPSLIALVYAVLHHHIEL